ncbi:hypothetical protein Tco_1357390, partial [Tanacetum coccineum]
NTDNEDDDGQDDDNEQTESDNDGEDFVHPNFSTHDEEERQEEEDKEEEGDNDEGEELDEEETNEEEEVNELYKDVNVNLERRDAEMTYAPQTNVQGTQVTEDTHVIITAATPEVQHQSSSVSSRFISNMLNPILIIVKALEDDFSEFKQTNHFAEAVSLIPGIVDQYLANKMNEAIKAAVQLQLDRLRSKAQADNEDFINKIDENMKKIIKEQVKTSHVVAANLSELELKKILIDKMENNKSIDRSVQHKNLYKALVDAYESDKDIFASYGDIVTLKRRQDDEDEDEEPFARSNRGSKRRIARKEPESTSAPKEKTSKSTGKSKEGSKSHQKYTVNGEYARDVYSIHRILAVTKLKIVEWHNYKHLDWITVRKLTNLNIEERLALGVSLRMFTRSIVLRRHVEDLQLGVESYQKKLNLSRPDTYRSDLKRKSSYTTYSNPKGFIYQNKDKKNILMRIDELHKFSDVWRNIDREREGAMIQAIDRQLKNRRLMKSLEKFIGERLYGGDLWLLERTI